ncbi:MAG: hypothetical protein IJV76_03065, partial [Clostridia bacterium]|nr:hypothetical protein [Clostridia bacterium]
SRSTAGPRRRGGGCGRIKLLGKELFVKSSFPKPHLQKLSDCCIDKASAERLETRIQVSAQNYGGFL